MVKNVTLTQELQKKEIVITREFDAPRTRVWNAWTNPEMIKKWWGPKDFTAPTIKIDLREGGKYLYCMHGPKGTEFDRDFWSAGIFKEIVPMEKIVLIDFFSDDNGNRVDPVAYGMSQDFPKETNVIIKFEDAGNHKTKLTIGYPRHESDAAFDAMKKSGMEMGWSQSFDKLVKILAKVSEEE